MIQPGFKQFRPTTAIVDLKAIAENFSLVRAAVAPGAFLCPMVKANAYGHGDIAVAKRLRSAGATALGVGLIEEGLHLRGSGDLGELYYFGAFDLAGAEALCDGAMVPVISSIASLHAWARAAKRLSPQRPRPFHLKINTGMNRLGLAPTDIDAAREFIRQHGEIQLTGLSTHFAIGEDAGSSGGFSAMQLQRFEAAIAHFSDVVTTGLALHVSNSAAITRRLSRAPLVLGARPGLAIYGVESPGAPLGLHPSLKLISQIVHTQDLRPGDRVSYGGHWAATRLSRIGVIPCGYADGYHRALGGGQVLINGRRAPLVGAVCMDYVMCDLTDLATTGTASGVGSEVVLIGAQGGERIGAEELAARMETIPYEILTGLSERVPRLYVDGGSPASVS